GFGIWGGKLNRCIGACRGDRELGHRSAVGGDGCVADRANRQCSPCGGIHQKGRELTVLVGPNSLGVMLALLPGTESGRFAATVGMVWGVAAGLPANWLVVSASVDPENGAV